MKMSVPKIIQSFASSKIRPGDIWKVYLKAMAPDGFIKAVFTLIEQPGVGEYPVSITRIKKESRKESSGYIYLNTATPDNLNFVNVTATIQIQDNYGRFSEPVAFPLSFHSRYTQETPPPGVFKDEDLGPIMVHLRTVRLS